MNKLEISIPSSYSNLRQVERFIESIIVTFKVPGKLQLDLMLAIVEASYNAMLPGNQQEEEKCVKFSAVKSRRKIVVTIEDDGDGFDYTHPPYPLSKEGQGLTGRGIYMMVALSDELQFINKGAKIIMSFFLDKDSGR